MARRDERRPDPAAGRRYVARARTARQSTMTSARAVRCAAERMPVAIVSAAPAPRSSRARARRLSALFARRLRRTTSRAASPIRSPTSSPPRVSVLAPAELVGFEDTEVGVASAKAAGMRVVGSPARSAPSGWQRPTELVERHRRRPCAELRRARDRPPRRVRGAAGEHARGLRARDRDRRRLHRARRHADAAAGSSSRTTRRAAARSYPTLEEAVDLCRGRIGADGRVEDTAPLPPPRHRRRAPSGCSATTALVCFQRARARGGARAAPRPAHGAARRLRRLDPRRRSAWAAGFQDARVTRARARGRAGSGSSRSSTRSTTPARMRELRARRRRHLHRPAGPGSSASCRRLVRELEQPRVGGRHGRRDARPDRQLGRGRGRARRRSARCRPDDLQPRHRRRGTSASSPRRRARSAGAPSPSARDELDRLGPDQQQHPLAARAARARRRPRARTPPCSTVAGRAVDDRRLEPVHRADELGDERRRRRRCTSPPASPSARSGRRYITATWSETESASSWSCVT